MTYIKNLFDGTATAYDSGEYCDFSSVAAQAIAGKDIILSIWNTDGTTLYALSGQQSLTINRTADSIEVTTKDTEGGWKSEIAGMKEWSIDVDGVYSVGDESQNLLSKAWEDSELVCVKVYDKKRKKGMFGGVCSITDNNIEAPFDDAVTYSVSLKGVGKLTDLTRTTPSSDTEPTA